MLIATWVIAIATTILALSGPVVLLQWHSERRRESERRQREREEKVADAVLARGEHQFVPKTWITGYAPLTLLLASMFAAITWISRSRTRESANQ